MPAIAQILEAHYGLRCDVLFARPTPQSNTNIEGLNQEALEDTALLVMFLRWRVLPDAQIEPILDYVKSGFPLVGFRTSTHPFKYPEGHKYYAQNDEFPLSNFGAKWTRHHGHMSTTRTTAAAPHPIMSGVNPEMTLPSWLYTVNPLQGANTPVLTGHAINPQNARDDGPQPVAWVRENSLGARVFFTTLGHPKDFSDENFRRLAVNGILWALGKSVPKKGAKIEIPAGYHPPESGYPK